jgi:glutathione reductase (NADPH)
MRSALLQTELPPACKQHAVSTVVARPTSVRRMQNKEVGRICNVYREVLRNNGVELVEGRAAFQDAHTIAVHNAAGDLVRTLTAKNILIATGGEPHVPEIPGAKHAITSDQALCLPEAPKRVAVVGAGRVGTEFAGIFVGMGAAVHMVFKDELPLPGASAQCHADLRCASDRLACKHFLANRC